MYQYFRNHLETHVYDLYVLEIIWRHILHLCLSIFQKSSGDTCFTPVNQYFRNHLKTHVYSKHVLDVIWRHILHLCVSIFQKSSRDTCLLPVCFRNHLETHFTPQCINISSEIIWRHFFTPVYLYFINHLKTHVSEFFSIHNV